MALDEDERPRARRDKVRVWDEITLRVSVGDNDYNFLRFTHGQEAWAANNPRARARAERDLHESILEIATARVNEFEALIREVKEK